MIRGDVRIEIAAEPRLLEAVRGLVRGYMRALGVIPDKTEEIVLAVDEACANSIRHSYAGSRGDGVLELELRANARDIRIVLRDTGIPAPAARVRPRKLLPPDVATLKPGGLGVQLIYQVFDEVEFHPGKDRGNEVIMRFRRPDAHREEGRKTTEG